MLHELRLYRRGLSSSVGGKIAAICLLVLMHLIAIPLAFALRHIPAATPDYVAIGLTLGGGCVVLLMISRGLIMSVQALYTRGDMDLLLSSPVAPLSIISARAAAIAASVTLEAAFLIWPFANVFVLFGLLAWTKAYILLPAFGLLATSISLMLSLLLFYVFGARRTRIIAQVMSALIALSFIILVQLPNILANCRGCSSTLGAGAYEMYPLSPDRAVWWPAFAVMEGFLPTIAFAFACAALFACTVRALAGSFIGASIASAGIGVGRGRRRPAGTLRFHGSTRLILILKELRLIGRDPWLLTQLLQQSVFLLPLSVVLWRRSGSGLPLVWGLAILFAAFTAGALAWITVAAEDVPELVATAPVRPREIARIKLEAALLPILPIALLPLLVLWRTHGWFGFSIAVCALGASLSCARLNIHDRPPGKRRDFRMRRKGNSGQGFVEIAIVSGWVGLCALMVWLSPWR